MFANSMEDGIEQELKIVFNDIIILVLSDDKVLVFFVDYGNYDEVKL